MGGAGGQGESELQLQRRRITDRRRQLLRGLEQVRKTRAVQRAARQRSGKPQVCGGGGLKGRCKEGVGERGCWGAASCPVAHSHARTYVVIRRGCFHANRWQ